MKDVRLLKGDIGVQEVGSDTSGHWGLDMNSHWSPRPSDQPIAGWAMEPQAQVLELLGLSCLQPTLSFLHLPTQLPGPSLPCSGCHPPFPLFTPGLPRVTPSPLEPQEATEHRVASRQNC